MRTRYTTPVTLLVEFDYFPGRLYKGDGPDIPDSVEILAIGDLHPERAKPLPGRDIADEVREACLRIAREAGK
jgi:hypothetical protein